MIDKILWYLLAGTKGGETRARIIHSIMKKPQNANQLSSSLNLDYKTIQHHLRILLENRMMTVFNKEKYGAVYFLSDEMKGNMGIFKEILAKFGKNLGKDS